MANFRTSKKCSTEVVTYVSVFETQLDREIRTLLNQDRFVHLLINCTVILEDNPKVLTLEHDAKVSLSGSMPFVAELQMYLKGKEPELNQCLSAGHGVLIELKFKEREKRVGKNDVDVHVFTPCVPKWNLSQVILPIEVKSEIQEAINLIRYQHLIYDEWGFRQIDPVAKSVLNFYGPAGTGKTMCAHAVANCLGKKILACNYSEIESKYVGDAAKNLANAFETAKNEDCVLFFDEADSFLGKRIMNVSQGADQALNSLRSQMLILLEEFPGVVLFATNLVSNFDSAFESRILKHIRFELPNEEARKEIIRGALPHNLPYESGPFSEDELSQLSVIMDGRAGREIKSAILECMLSKVTAEGESSIFSFGDFVQAFNKKQETLKILEEEKDRIQKEKIIKAMSRKLDAENEARLESNQEEVSSGEINQNHTNGEVGGCFNQSIDE